MATWLEFRSEPLSDVPEVKTKTEFREDLPVYVLNCTASDCSWVEETEDVVYSDELRIRHETWHEEGMPQ